MDDSRRHPRIPIISIARLTHPRIQTEVRALIRNISTHGLGICFRREVYQKGDTVVVHLALCTGQEALSESIMGEVVWVASLPRRGDYGVGIRFDDLERQKPRLYEHIKSLEAMSD